MAKGKRTKTVRRLERWRTGISVALLIVFSVTGGGCFLDQEVEPYYGRINVPRAQEFRWSDGGLPQTFDPALAAAPPDTDAVRAIFEGLTDYDPHTLSPVPGVAARWESSADNREWTFYLRQDARWSNGEPVTARDFVNSWQRTLQLGERAPHARLLENIQGAKPFAAASPQPSNAAPSPAEAATPPAQARAAAATEGQGAKHVAKKEERSEPPAAFGAEAVSDYVLRVRLQQPDQSFPSLVAHPVFRPVHRVAEAAQAEAALVSNGAFQLVKADTEGVVLERARNYWDARTVNLQRVQFVKARDTESALAAYHAGEVDAVTNAGFEPLALKLLAPYKDFRRATFGALTYYSFNIERAPFDDVRVREALAIAIDRDRISEDKMEGATEPAKKFLPVQMPAERGQSTEGEAALLEHNAARARSLLAEAGFPGGNNFPRIRLLVNRNDQQRTVAQSIAVMWKNVLGVETELIIKSWDEYEAAVRAGDYDVVRRGVVMQTMDEVTNMRLILEPEANASTATAETAGGGNSQTAESTPEAEKSANPASESKPAAAAEERASLPQRVLTEEQALRELQAIPIYFASSYSLVKPYVVGFDSNLLDAPSLKHVRIDTAWQSPKPAPVAWLK